MEVFELVSSKIQKFYGGGHNLSGMNKHFDLVRL